MHRIWYARGYQKEHLKLTFRGRHFDGNESLRYNAPHNELIVNANAPMSEVLYAALAWGGPPIRWLHGYPSLVSEFAHALDNATSYSRERFRSRLFGVLLGSEYPALAYRKPIEEKLSINIVSWYGHSEMAVLAAETMRGVYRSLPTYGFAEAIPIENSNGYRLICTSFDNYCHPFIRYDTGDIIEPLSDGTNGLCFRILEGRVGDFILDRHGRRHSLTAVIFGRHHPAFANLAHVQVSQQNPGRATLLVTLREPNIPLDVISAGFDLSGVDIEWDINIVAEPIRSKAGKIKLKVD